MDRSTRRLDASAKFTPPAPEDAQSFNTQPSYPAMPHTIPVGGIPGGIRPNHFPVGENQRNPSSPFPPETGKRTLETGPSYER